MTMLNQPPPSSFLSSQPSPYGQQSSPWAFSPAQPTPAQAPASPTLVQDPTTGLILDTATGIAYDPSTGQPIDPENPITQRAELGVTQQAIATKQAMLSQQAAMQHQEAGNVLNDNAAHATALLTQPGLPQALTQQLTLELESLKGTQSLNEAKAGVIGNSWDALISTVGADGDDPRWYDPRHLLGLQKDKSSGAVQDNLLKHQQLLLTMQNISPLVGTDPQATAHFATLYQEVTGRPLNAAELETNLPTGLLAQSKAAQKVEGYQANQKLGQDILKDTATGFIALGAIALAPVSGGLSLGALGVAVGAGAVAKPTLSAINELTASDGEFEVNLAKDVLTGGVAGGTAILGEGVGNWAGQKLAKTIGITTKPGTYSGAASIAQRASSKAFGNAMTGGYTIMGNSLAKNALIRGTSIAVAGSLDGGVSGATSTLAEGGSVGDALRNAALGATVGIGFRGAGDLASRGLNATVFAKQAVDTAVDTSLEVGEGMGAEASQHTLPFSSEPIITPEPGPRPVDLSGDDTTTITVSAVVTEELGGALVLLNDPTTNPNLSKAETTVSSLRPFVTSHAVAPRGSDPEVRTHYAPSHEPSNGIPITSEDLDRAVSSYESENKAASANAVTTPPGIFDPTALKASLDAEHELLSVLSDKVRLGQTRDALQLAQARGYNPKTMPATDTLPEKLNTWVTSRQERIQNALTLIDQQDTLKAGMSQNVDSDTVSMLTTDSGNPKPIVTPKGSTKSYELDLLTNSFNEVRTKTTRKGVQALPSGISPLETRYGHQAPQSLQADQTLAFLREEVRELLPEKPQHVQALAQHHTHLGYNLSELDARVMLRQRMAEFKAANPQTPLSPWDVMGMMADVDKQGVVFAKELQELGQRFAGATPNATGRDILRSIGENPASGITALTRTADSPHLHPPDNNGWLAFNPFDGDKHLGQQTDFIPYGRATQQAEGLLSQAEKGKTQASDNVMGILKDMTALNKGETLPVLQPSSAMATLTPSQQGLMATLADTDPMHPVALALKNNPDLDVLKLRDEIDRKVWSALDYKVTDSLDDEAREQLLDQVTTALLAFRQVEDRANVALGSPYKINANTTRQLQGGGLNKQMAPAKTPYQFNPAEQVFLEDVVANINAYNGTANLGDALNTTLDTLLNKDTLAFVPKGYGRNSPPALDVRTQQREALEAVIANGQKALATSDPIRTLPPSAAEQLVTLATALDTRDYASVDSAWTSIVTNDDLTLSEQIRITSRIDQYAVAQGQSFDVDTFLAINNGKSPAALPPAGTTPPPVIPEPVAVPPPPAPEPVAPPASPEVKPVAPPQAKGATTPATHTAPATARVVSSLDRQPPQFTNDLSQNIEILLTDINNGYNFYRGLDSHKGDVNGGLIQKRQIAYLKDLKRQLNSDATYLAGKNIPADEIMTKLMKKMQQEANKMHAIGFENMGVFAGIPKQQAQAIISDFRKVFTYQTSPTA